MPLRIQKYVVPRDEREIILFCKAGRRALEQGRREIAEALARGIIIYNLLHEGEGELEHGKQRILNTRRAIARKRAKEFLQLAGAESDPERTTA